MYRWRMKPQRPTASAVATRLQLDGRDRVCRWRYHREQGPMTEILEEFSRPTWLSFPVIAARLLCAALFGALIGFEREWRKRPAGLRTHILVCVAAATFVILTIEIAHAPIFGRDSITMDPLRVVEAVTAGVAFLAAGTIMVARGQVRGLTTGAGMWLAGAVGLACGLGL